MLSGLTNLNSEYANLTRLSQYAAMNNTEVSTLANYKFTNDKKKYYRALFPDTQREIQIKSHKIKFKKAISKRKYSLIWILKTQTKGYIPTDIIRLVMEYLSFGFGPYSDQPGLDLSNIDYYIDNTDIKYSHEIRHGNFSGSNFSNKTFKSLQFIKTDFSGSDFTDARFNNCLLHECNFTNIIYDLSLSVYHLFTNTCDINNSVFSSSILLKISKYDIIKCEFKSELWTEIPDIGTVLLDEEYKFTISEVLLNNCGKTHLKNNENIYIDISDDGNQGCYLGDEVTITRKKCNATLLNQMHFMNYSYINYNYSYINYNDENSIINYKMTFRRRHPEIIVINEKCATTPNILQVERELKHIDYTNTGKQLTYFQGRSVSTKEIQAIIDNIKYKQRKITNENARKYRKYNRRDIKNTKQNTKNTKRNFRTNQPRSSHHKYMKSRVKY